MAIKARCIVTNSVEGRGAYAIRADNDEKVYVPHGMTDRTELEEFDEVLAILVANPKGTDQIPWMAIKVKRLGEE